MDTPAELAGVLGLTLAGVGRCASDLYYWSSSEVGMVRLHPSLYSSARLVAILDARSFVDSRTSAGGTSVARRQELAAEAAADIDVHRRTVGALIDGVERARRRLVHDARALVERLNSSDG